MIIAAIDPGPLTSGYVLWNTEIPRVIDAGDDVTNAVLLRDVLPRMFGAAGQREVRLAIEKVMCYGRPVGAPVLDTVFFSGRIAERWELRTGTPAAIVPFASVAAHFCHQNNAKESYVRQALMDRFGGKGTAKAPGVFYRVTGHAWSACALAVYIMDTTPAWTPLNPQIVQSLEG